MNSLSKNITFNVFFFSLSRIPKISLRDIVNIFSIFLEYVYALEEQ